MIVIDINTFFGPKAGGIRTFMLEKIEWFAAHPEHTLIVIYPGPTFKIQKPHPNVVLIEVFGFQMTSDPEGYRFLVDLRRVWGIIRRFKPNIIECGEPWLTGWFMRSLKGLKLIDIPIVQFYHSDPMRTYLDPWAQKKGSWAKFITRFFIKPLFYKMQSQYDATLVSSRSMESYLNSRKVQKTFYTPFGVTQRFAQNFQVKKNIPNQPIRILYGGRLDIEKGIDILKTALPQILSWPNTQVTIMGRGAESEYFSNFKHPHYEFKGFLSSRDDVLKMFNIHDIFLAPGPYETFGMSALEAMSMGLVVVGPDSGGVSDLLNEVENPYIFKAHDITDFISKLTLAINTPLEESSNAHHQVALKYGTWKDAFDHIMRFYNTLTP